MVHVLLLFQTLVLSCSTGFRHLLHTHAPLVSCGWVGGWVGHALKGRATRSGDELVGLLPAHSSCQCLGRNGGRGGKEWREGGRGGEGGGKKEGVREGRMMTEMFIQVQDG